MYMSNKINVSIIISTDRFIVGNVMLFRLCFKCSIIIWLDYGVKHVFCLAQEAQNSS